jgi:hypothetical protein
MFKRPKQSSPTTMNIYRIIYGKDLIRYVCASSFSEAEILLIEDNKPTRITIVSIECIAIGVLIKKV